MNVIFNYGCQPKYQGLKGQLKLIQEAVIDGSPASPWDCWLVWNPNQKLVKHYFHPNENKGLFVLTEFNCLKCCQMSSLTVYCKT